MSEEDYAKLKDIKKLIERHFPEYWERIFKVSVEEFQLPNGMRVKKDNQQGCSQLKGIANEWEGYISSYRDELAEILDIDMFDEDDEFAYDIQEFKDDIFAEHLWTVSSALNSWDPDLERYKKSFLQMPAKDVYVTTYNILFRAKEYMANVAGEIDHHLINQVDQLKYDFLRGEDMLLPGVIGYGIRSEILHRLYPSHFPIMTQRSLWGMYFLTGRSEEFITDRNMNGYTITEHNWNYDYERFAFYDNFICNLIEHNMKLCNLKMDPALRFGYANQFLSLIYKDHKKEVDSYKRG